MPTSACASPGKAEGGTGRPPPRKKNTGGGGGARTAHSHHTANKHHKRRPNPHPDGTEDRTPQRGAEGPPSQNRQHRAEGSGPTGEGTPKTRGHTLREKKKQQTTRPGREGMGGQRPRDQRPGQPATDTTQPPPKKKPKWRGGGQTPPTANTRTPPRHRRPPGKGGGKRGTRTTARAP